MSPQKYYFDTPINATSSIAKFWFEVDEKDGKKPTVLENGGSGYEIAQDKILFDPKRSSKPFFSGKTTIVAAVSLFFRSITAYLLTLRKYLQVRNDVTPSRVYGNVMWRQSTSEDRIFEFQLAEDILPTVGYVFYKVDVPGFIDFTIDIFSVVNGKTYTEDARRTEFIEFASPSSS